MARPLATETDKAELLDETINGFFERSIDYATRIDPSYRQLWETLYGLIRSGGKRLRPKMTLMAYEAFGGKDLRAIMPVAAAQELLHFCLLIHDDVIDRDYVRYGTANIAGRYKIAYSTYVSSPDDQTHYAHSAAILGGDLMLSGAHQMIASSTLSDHDKTLAQSYLAHSTFEVAGGELLDTELSFAPYTDGAALKVAKYKTASYSFVSPLLTGASLAGMDKKLTVPLHSYAMSLGIAYQLMDDLLGVFGDEAMTGKSTSSDITEGKRTYLVERTLAGLSTRNKAAFAMAFGNPDASSVEIENTKRLMEESGAKKDVETKIRAYIMEASEALDNLQLDERSHARFRELMEKVTERSF